MKTINWTTLKADEGKALFDMRVAEGERIAHKIVNCPAELAENWVELDYTLPETEQPQE